MKFTSIPEAYNSFREPLVYSFDTQTTTPTDVVIEVKNYHDDSIIGRKKLYSVTSGEVDIAPYLRWASQPHLPEKIEQCGVVDCGTQMTVYVEANGHKSKVRNYVAAKVDLDRLYTHLDTQINSRTMARDEFDLISFFSLPDVVVEVVVEAEGAERASLKITPDSGGQRTVAITAKSFDFVPDTISATIYVDGTATKVIDYQIKPNLRGAHRLLWINRHSSPEAYTFPLRKSVLIVAARKHIESVWGKKAAALEGKGELKLLSAYEPQAQVEALAEIVHSERLWLADGTALRDVALKSDMVLAMPCDSMGIVEVDLSAAKEGELLW